MNLFSKFFNCGAVYIRSNSSPSQRCDFIVQDINLLLDNIIPHFDLYPIFNLKNKDFICFKKALDMIKSKKHLTQEGLDKIKALNLEMNELLSLIEMDGREIIVRLCEPYQLVRNDNLSFKIVSINFEHEMNSPKRP